MLTFVVFFTTYLFSSLLCFYIDYNYPNFRNDSHILQNKIMNNYKNILPLVITNLILSIPVFYYFEPIIEAHAPNDYNILINLVLWIISADFLFYVI
jgi:hypothetical protein